MKKSTKKTLLKPDSKPFGKAYHNFEFMRSREARSLRLLSEYLEPAARFKHYHVVDTIVFFGSARTLDREAAMERLAEVKERMRDIPSPTRELLRELQIAEGLMRMVPFYEAAEELAFRLTKWSKRNARKGRRFIVTTGGGDGIMGAANKGASKAGGLTAGLNISLPMEQAPNPYISSELQFEFHYFFMRKFWFLYLAKALVVLPGGFGTLDELMECLTLIQTEKLAKEMTVVLFGSEFWNDIINFERMVHWSVIAPEDLDLFYITDSVEDAFRHITGRLEKYLPENTLEQ